MNIKTSAAIFKALGDPQRLRILQLLAQPPVNACAEQGSVCACDLIAHLNLSQPTVSHHMRLLVQAGLVRATRRGKWMDYTLRTEGLEAVQDVLSSLLFSPQGQTGQAAHPVSPS